MKKSSSISLTFLKIFSAIIITLFVFSANIIYISFDESFFEKEFAKYDVYASFEGSGIGSINAEVLGFLRGNNALPENFFNEREIIHLNDVKKIYDVIFIVFYLSILSLVILIISLVYLLERKNLVLLFIGKAFIISFIVIVAVSALLIAAFGADFSFAFDVFHKAFFEKGSYLFDPSYENIVILYPGGLFYDAGLRILVNVLVSGLVLGVVGVVLGKIS